MLPHRSAPEAWTRNTAVHSQPLHHWLPLLVLALLGCYSCGKTDVGSPCIPEEEYDTEFAGFTKQGVGVETRSYQCESRLCLVNRFQGRVSCPYGQKKGADECATPDGLAPVTVAVAPQLATRPPEDAVYCSCRCDGPRKEGPYCACPEGFACYRLVADLPVADSELVGSYCVKNGTNLEPGEIADRPCDRATEPCGSVD